MIQSKQMHFLRIGRRQRGSQDFAFPLPSRLLLVSLASVAFMLSCDVKGPLVMKLGIFPFVFQVRGVVFDFSEKNRGGTPHQITATPLSTHAVDKWALKPSLPVGSTRFSTASHPDRKSRQNSGAEKVCSEKSIQLKPHS